MTRPIVVAHAGASGHAPANTFGAYRRAHDDYPDVWMEFDAQFSSDDIPMAIHDETLDRTTDASGLVSDRTADDLQKVNAAATYPGWDFEPVPRVQDIVEEGRDAGWRLICEVKNIPGQRSLRSSGESYAETLNKIFVDIEVPARSPRGDLLLGPHARCPEETQRRDRARLPHRARTAGRYGTDSGAEPRYLSRSRIPREAPRHSTPDFTSEHVVPRTTTSIQVHVWTTNEPEEIEAAIAKDLDGITSDYPDRVLQRARPLERGLLGLFFRVAGVAGPDLLFGGLGRVAHLLRQQVALI